MHVGRVPFVKVSGVPRVPGANAFARSLVCGARAFTRRRKRCAPVMARRVHVLPAVVRCYVLRPACAIAPTAPRYSEGSSSVRCRMGETAGAW